MAQVQDTTAPLGRETKRIKTEHGTADNLESPGTDSDGAALRSTFQNVPGLSNASGGGRSWSNSGNNPSNGSSFVNTPDALQTPASFSRTESSSRVNGSTTIGMANAGEAFAQTSSVSRPTSGPMQGGIRKDEGTSEVDQLQDLLGMSGVDLRAEEEAIHGLSIPTYGAPPGSQAPLSSSRPSPFYLELYPLSHRIHKIAARNGLEVEPDVLMLLSRAAKMRFHNLLQAMISASRHRQWSSHRRPPPMFPGTNKPMYHEAIYDDPNKLLNALNRVDKAEEQAARQLRIEREEMEARVAAGQAEDESRKDADASASGQNDGPAGSDEAKRKGKKQGASAAARNMTEDKRLKLANNTAARALGISAGSKAWMFGSGALPGAGSGADSPAAAGSSGAARLPKPRFAPAQSTENGKVTNDGANGLAGNGDGSMGIDGAANPGGWGDLAARQRQRVEAERERERRVNLDDALFALEMERKGGAGRGSGERVLFAARALGRPTLPFVPSNQR